MEWKSGFLNRDRSSRPTTSGGGGTLDPPPDERIPSELWRQQDTDGESEQARRWQQAPADDTNTDGAGEGTGLSMAGSGWGSGGTSSYLSRDNSRQSSSGWGAAWREAVANGTAVASTTSTFNGGWGEPYRGGNDVCGWGTNMASNGINDTASSAAVVGKLFQFNAKISEMPCQCLEAWFSRKKVGGGVPKTCYSTWNIDPATPHEPKWVSIFTSPVDGECFISGQWKGCPTGYEKIEVAAVDGSKVSIPAYSKKVNAEHAAAGRALDCLSYRETNGEESYPYCLDDPYGPEKAPPLPIFMPDDVVDCKTTEVNHAPATSLVTPPKALLQQWYMERYADFPNAKFADYFECWHNGDERHKLWTCVFTELVSGTERFVCGRWGNGNTPKYEVIPERSSDKTSEAGVNVVWYTTKKNAEHAAAARALDCLRVRENRNDESPRLCLDVPYLSENDAPPLPFADALLEHILSDPLPTLAIRKLPKVLPMETEEEVQDRQEYRSSRTQPQTHQAVDEAVDEAVTLRRSL